MNENIQLYQWVRSDASIYVARIAEIGTQAGPPGQVAVDLEIKIEETLYGKEGEPLRRCKFLQPDSETTRLKFPDPIWGQVNLRKGLLILFVTHALSEPPADPLYVEEIVAPDDPVLNAVRAVLDQERTAPVGKAPLTRYLQYLTDGPAVQKLFGAEALAKDTDLPGVDQDGQVAMAMATVFASAGSVFVRISVGTWMWENIYPRTNTAGRVAVINATIRGVEDASEDIRRFSVDHLMIVNPTDLRQAGVIKSNEAVRLLQEQLQLETVPEVRDRIQQVIDALRK